MKIGRKFDNICIMNYVDISTKKIKIKINIKTNN